MSADHSPAAPDYLHNENQAANQVMTDKEVAKTPAVVADHKVAAAARVEATAENTGRDLLTVQGEFL